MDKIKIDKKEYVRTHVIRFRDIKKILDVIEDINKFRGIPCSSHAVFVVDGSDSIVVYLPPDKVNEYRTNKKLKKWETRKRLWCRLFGHSGGTYCEDCGTVLTGQA